MHTAEMLFRTLLREITAQQRGNDDKHGTNTVPDRDVTVLDALVGIALPC